MTNPDVLELLPLFEPGSFGNAAILNKDDVKALRDEITRLRASPWVSVEERPWPPIDPDENGSVSIAVLIAFEGDNPSPLDNVCYGWAEAKEWYMRGGEPLKSKVVAWMPIPRLDPTPEQV